MSALPRLFALAFAIHSLFLSAPADAGDCAPYRANWESCVANRMGDCGLDLLVQYTNNLFTPLNQSLRGIAPDPDCSALAAPLRKALLALPPTGPISVYRGAPSFPSVEKLRPGECYADPGFLSTSRTEEIAIGFQSGALYSISARSGRDLVKCSGHACENEVLLPPRTPLKLVSKTVLDGVYRYSFVEAAAKDCAGIMRITAGEKPLPPPGPVVARAVGATYGANVDPKALGNATAAAAAFTAGDDAAYEYKVSSQYLGDPYPGRDKSFRFAWKCERDGSSKGPFLVFIPAPAEGAKFAFGCSSAMTPMLALREIDPKIVHVRLAKAVDAAGKNWLPALRTAAPEPAASQEFALTPGALALAPESVPKSVAVAFDCVTARTAVRKTTVLKRADDGTLSGEASCLDLIKIQPGAK